MSDYADDHHDRPLWNFFGVDYELCFHEQFMSVHFQGRARG